MSLHSNDSIEAIVAENGKLFLPGDRIEAGEEPSEAVIRESC